MTKLMPPKTVLAALAALSISALSAQAQDFSAEAVQTGQDLTTASQGLYDIFTGEADGAQTGRQAITDFINGTSAEATEFFNDTTAQFAWNPEMQPMDAAAAGGLNTYAALSCASLPTASSYQGQGLSANQVISDFAMQIGACLDALDTVTNPNRMGAVLGFVEEGFGTNISQEFKSNVNAIDQARMEAILFAVAYPDCVMNQTSEACKIVAASQKP
jgi:hypothetical protein